MSAQIRIATLQDLRPLADLLTASFYCNDGWMRLLYPLLRLGIQEDLKTRLNANAKQYACLAAVYPQLHGQSHGHGQSPDRSMTMLPDGEQLVGTVEISCRPTYIWFLRQPRYLYLSNLAVASRFRRQGIALQLLCTCESLAFAWGFRELYLHVMEDNAKARSLYQKAGYRTKSLEWNLTATLLGKSRRLLLHKPLNKATCSPYTPLVDSLEHWGKP